MVQICFPLPDELAKSHLIRLQRINAIATPNRALAQLYAVKGLGKHLEVVPARRIALAIGACPEQYIRHHTFLAYRMSWATGAAVGNGKRDYWRTRDGLRSLAAPAPVLAFCRQCTSEDIEMLGFSYWRRRHQLAGATYCARHHRLLTHLSHGAPKANSLPQEHLTRSPLVGLKVTAAQLEAVLRYQALGEALVTRKRALSLLRSSFKYWVCSRLAVLDDSSAALELPQHCLSTFGVGWMQQMWSSTAKRKCLKSISVRLQHALNVVAVPPSIEVFTLIATALTSTVHEALATLEGLSTEGMADGPFARGAEASR